MSTDDEYADDTGQGPLFWRVGRIGNLIGMSPHVFEQGCVNGDIPCQIHYIGPKRFRYVRRSELEAWLGRKFD